MFLRDLFQEVPKIKKLPKDKDSKGTSTKPRDKALFDIEKEILGQTGNGVTKKVSERLEISNPFSSTNIILLSFCL